MIWPQQIIITGIRMQLSHMQGDTPVYTYFIDGTQINYINHNLKRENLTIPQ